LPGASLALLLVNLSGVLAPGIVPWQNATFLVVIQKIEKECHCFSLEKPNLKLNKEYD